MLQICQTATEWAGEIRIEPSNATDPTDEQLSALAAELVDRDGAPLRINRLFSDWRGEVRNEITRAASPLQRAGDDPAELLLQAIRALARPYYRIQLSRAYRDSLSVQRSPTIPAPVRAAISARARLTRFNPFIAGDYIFGVSETEVSTSQDSSLFQRYSTLASDEVTRLSAASKVTQTQERARLRREWK